MIKWEDEGAIENLAAVIMFIGTANGDGSDVQHRPHHELVERGQDRADDPGHADPAAIAQ
jgi:hypothetical protein